MSDYKNNFTKKERQEYARTVFKLSEKYDLPQEVGFALGTNEEAYDALDARVEELVHSTRIVIDKFELCSDNDRGEIERVLGPDVSAAIGLYGMGQRNLTRIADYLLDVEEEQAKNLESKMYKKAADVVSKLRKIYKDDENMLKIITEDNFVKATNAFRYFGGSELRSAYDSAIKFFHELGQIPEKTLKNVPSLITLTWYDSNINLEKALNIYVPRSKKEITVSYKSAGGLEDILTDFVSSKHESLTGNTVKESIAKFRLGKLSLEDIKRNNFGVLNLPYFRLTFDNIKSDGENGIEWSDINTYGSHFSNQELTIEAIKKFPEIAKELKIVCEERIKECDKRLIGYKPYVSFNENPVVPSEDHFIMHDYHHVIKALKNIIEICNEYDKDLDAVIDTNKNKPAGEPAATPNITENVKENTNDHSSDDLR